MEIWDLHLTSPFSTNTCHHPQTSQVTSLFLKLKKQYWRAWLYLYYKSMNMRLGVSKDPMIIFIGSWIYKVQSWEYLHFKVEGMSFTNLHFKIPRKFITLHLYFHGWPWKFVISISLHLLSQNQAITTNNSTSTCQMTWNIHKHMKD